MRTTTYVATAERAGKSWHIEVPVIARVTQGRWASEVEPMARDLIAQHLDVPTENVAVDIEWKLPGDTSEHVARSRMLRDEAAAANAESAAEARRAAHSLHEAGLGSTEIGTVLGVSRQRAHQLITS
jgi:hypothetical protein